MKTNVSTRAIRSLRSYSRLIVIVSILTTLTFIFYKTSPNRSDNQSTKLLSGICRELFTQPSTTGPFISKLKLADKNHCESLGHTFYDGECILSHQVGKVFYDPCNPKGSRVINETFVPFNGRDYAQGPGIGGLERHRFYCRVFPELIAPLMEEKVRKTKMFDDSSTEYEYEQSRIVNSMRVLAFGPQREKGNARTWENVAFSHGGYPVDYILADFSEKIQKKFGAFSVNAEDVKFPSAFFHAVQFSHILEHVDSIETTLKELSRILVPGGFVVLSCPIDIKRKTTVEDKDCVSEACRLEKFGQEDHIRLIGRDLIDLIGQHFEHVYFERIYDYYTKKHPELRTIFRNPEFTETSKELFIIAVKGGGDVPNAADAVFQ